MFYPLEVLVVHDALSLLSNSSLTALAAVSKSFQTQSRPAFRLRWREYLARNVGFTDSEAEDDNKSPSNVSYVRAR